MTRTLAASLLVSACGRFVHPAGCTPGNCRRWRLPQESVAPKLEEGRDTPQPPVQAAVTLPEDSTTAAAAASRSSSVGAKKNACLFSKLLPALAVAVVLLNPAAL